MSEVNPGDNPAKPRA